MKRKRYTTEQIIAILRQPDTGKTVQEVCRGNNLSEQTFYRWRKKYGNLELADAKRFKELEKENTELKKMRAEKGLCSLRRACAYLSLSWSTFSYRPKQARKKAQRLAERILTLS